MSRRFLASVVFFAACCVPAFAANNFASKRSAVELPALAAPARDPRVGEKLLYEVSWIGVPVGYGELWVKEKTVIHGREAYHVVATALTNEVLSKIYPVHDEIHSWIDAETLQSLQFQKTVSEGFYRADERVLFDASLKKGFYESLKNGTKKEFDIHVPVHDVISAFFWTRRQVFKPGDRLHTIVNNGEKDYDLHVDILSHEWKEIRGQGSADLLKLEPKTELKGVLERRGRVWIHLENTPARVPILITFRTPFGPIVGVLKGRSDAVKV